LYRPEKLDGDAAVVEPAAVCTARRSTDRPSSPGTNVFFKERRDLVVSVLGERHQAAEAQKIYSTTRQDDF